MQNRFPLLLLLFTLLIPGSFSQTPEKIYGKNQVLKPNSYYLEQIPLWRKIVDEHPQNAAAWLNYYRASRNAYIKGEEGNAQGNKGEKRFLRLQNIVTEMEQQVPDSYEFHFATWLNGNNDLELFPHLEKAHALAPEEPEPLMALMLYYEITGDYALRDSSSITYIACANYSPGLLNYSHNLLSALAENALLLTEGDKDTEAAFLLQGAWGYRKDVRVLNINLLLNPAYRERVFAELQIPQLDFNPLENDENYARFQSQLIDRVAANGDGRAVYAANTVSKGYTSSIPEKLHCIGLASRYESSGADYTEILRKNVEEIYALDYITLYLYNDISLGNVHSINGNYFAPFSLLSTYYQGLGNTEKHLYYKQMAQKVALESDEYYKYQEYYGEK